MPKIRDALASEQTDAENAAAAAAAGRSLTGLSGRHSELKEPLFGERVTQRPGMKEIDPAAPMPGEGAGPSGIPPGFRMPQAKERVPFGEHEQQLAYPERPGYRNYWFNDTPGRIQRALKAGYAHVIDPNTGAPMSIITDRTLNGGRASYLMETPRQYYNADMAAAASRLDRRLRDIREGKAGPGASDGRYIPQQGISITGR